LKAYHAMTAFEMIRDRRATPPPLLPVAVARMTGIGAPPAIVSLQDYAPDEVEKLTGCKQELHVRQCEQTSKNEYNTREYRQGYADDHSARDLRRGQCVKAQERQRRTCLEGSAVSSDIEQIKPTPHMTKQPGRSPMKKVQPGPQPEKL